MASDIHTIYDELITAKKQRKIPGPLVISNSYGLYTCSAPAALPEDHPYLDIVVEAVNTGIPVVFAAGNSHWDVLCKNDPKACSPNTIWAVNSHDMVMSVGTVNENESNQDTSTPHPNSSRGPGQWARATTKPDCVAPTYGEIVWGCGYRLMDWWGTSGACPQVAGLAALLLSANPALSPAQVYNIIRSTCKPLGAPPLCVGSGLIDCSAAVARAKKP
jgi:subtilisin family serine protease